MQQWGWLPLGQPHSLEEEVLQQQEEGQPACRFAVIWGSACLPWEIQDIKQQQIYMAALLLLKNLLQIHG